jgi:hypothetical protein
MTQRIYVASSWRNSYQPTVVDSLRFDGHEVYDFRHPTVQSGEGFHWSEIDGGWQQWSPEKYRDILLHHPLCAQGFMSDLRALRWCDTCVLVMPCGRSSHLELGFCAGAGKRTIILLETGEPELMNLLADDLVLSIQELRQTLRKTA